MRHWPIVFAALLGACAGEKEYVPIYLQAAPATVAEGMKHCSVPGVAVVIVPVDKPCPCYGASGLYFPTVGICPSLPAVSQAEAEYGEDFIAVPGYTRYKRSGRASGAAGGLPYYSWDPAAGFIRGWANGYYRRPPPY